MWLSMLALLDQYGIRNVNFKEFIADNVQTNFNAVRRIFGSKDKSVPMEEKKRNSLVNGS